MAVSMDRIVTTEAAPGVLPGEEFAPVAALPPENRLDMPVQSLRRWRRSEERKPVGGTGPGALGWLARLVVFGGALALTAYGAREMYEVVSVSRTTWLQWALLILFTINFSWIAIAFTSAIVGFVALLFRSRARPAPVGQLAARTAVVMPVYNEETSRTFAALFAMRESIEATGCGAAFDYFVLSDTTNPDVWVSEERAFLALREQMGPDARLYYRRRPKNTHRKAGNIADFVTRWGGAYENMLVLDADSVMTGDCIVRLAAAMEADPDAGIIQTLPLIINRNTLFARLQQFAARVYGPVIATGLSVWMGKDGNYWGHNAIIRTRAFAAHCGLPDFPGRPPFGGHIMSHDFVEAALIRRAGWTVYMLPELAGSYEESPPSLIDLAQRDRRWCQGNLQHARVIGSAGLKWATRQHFATGIFSYLASPLWLMQLVIGIILVLQSRYVRPEYFSQEFSLYPTWPRFDPERALALFILTMAILLAPKLFGLVLTLLNGEERRKSGGGVRIILSTLFETIMSALLAPIMMVIQSGAVMQILLGRDTGWNPQRRDDGSIAFMDIVRRHWQHMALGVIAGLTAFLIATSLALWMSPTIIGLLLAIPISWMSGKRSIGMFLKRIGLLLTPEEVAPPAVVTRSNALQQQFASRGFDDEDAFEVLRREPALRQAHIDMLPPRPERKRGQVDPEHVLAEAKLADAQTVLDARSWLSQRERIAVLSDPELLAGLAQLKAVN